MKVAVVHGYYSSRVPSGENVVVDLQADALRRAGHDVEVFAIGQDEVEHGRGYVLGAAWRAATGRGPAPELGRFEPDVVHVHNLFPNFGRRWTSEYADRLVATLHNYRPMCPAATLFRDGHDCTECPDGLNARPSVRHACYKDSRLASVPVAIGTRFAEDPLLTAASRLVALNDGMAERYAAVGVPRGKLVTVPNFVPDPGVAPAAGAVRSHWLYVGRLTPEKGILPLVRQWPAGQPLRVVGSGPLEEDVRRAAAARPEIELLGMVDHSLVLELLAGARGLVFPSLWPEGLPTVYLEALAAGTPVLASRESVVGRLVAEQGTGMVVTDGWPAALASFADAPTSGEHCRRVFEEHYTESAWLSRIEEVYSEVSGRL
jgi:glycosyltransferase involved in cell wall biosynthesis